MKRTQIYLDDGQQKILKIIAAEKQCSVSELIRQAIHSLTLQFTPKNSKKKNPLSSITALYNNSKDLVFL